MSPAGNVSTFATGVSGSYLAFGPAGPVITPPKPPVITKPKIVTQPKAATVKPGTTVKLTVKATGSATLTYKWERNNVALKNSTTISGVTTATLTIKKVKTANAGTYRVIVTNKGGSATSVSVSPRSRTTRTGCTT